MTTFAANRARHAAALAAAQPRPQTTYAVAQARAAAQPRPQTTYAVAQARAAAQPRQTLRAITARRARLDRKVAEIAKRVPFAACVTRDTLPHFTFADCTTR